MSRLVTTAAAAFYVVATGGTDPRAWALLGSQVFGADQDRIARKRRRAAERAAKDSATDRLEMVERDPQQARTLPLGRVRAVEGVRRYWQSGTYSEKLTMVVSHGGVEIDAIESYFLNDLAVTLNGSWYVQEEPYNKGTRESAGVFGTLDGSGGAVVILDHTPVSGSVNAVNIVGSFEYEVSTAISVSVVGTTATISGGTDGAKYGLTYDYTQSSSLVRLRPYLGTASQNIGSALASEYDGAITSTDKFAGMACTVMDLTFDPDAFPTGRPTLTAVLRGAKCYDPRKDSTVPGGSGSHRYATPSTWEWSENPAILALRYATWESGLNVPLADIRLADFMTAADVCDVSTVFTLRKADDSTEDVTLPRYRCGIVVTGENPRAEMDAIVETMAGRWAWSGGQLRIRAGAMADPVATIDSTWYMQDATGGEIGGDAVISGANTVTRDQRINRVSGSCVDPDQRWQVLPYPAVSDDVLIASKGLRAAEVSYEGVNHIAHAQHLGSIAIRGAQAGLRIDQTLGLQALGLEVLDVVEIDLARYGFIAKTAEIVGWQWASAAVVNTQVAEITEAMFTVDAELGGRDPAPDSNLRRPWDVEQITGLAVTSDTAATQDGSIMSRTVVEWDAATGQSIRQGGQIEVQFAKVGDDFPDAEWPSWIEAGTATKAVIPGLLSNRAYRFRARAVQPMPLVRGNWSESVQAIIAGPRAALTYYQTGAPTGDVRDGDLWIDIDDGNALYLRRSGSWVSIRDTGIAAALLAAADAQATADGKIDTYWQTSAPGSASEGDIWFDTDDGNKQYRYTSGSWVAAGDTRIGQAISDAADAQATADGKVVTFVQSSAPTAEAIGDLWLDTDDGNKLYRWSGSAWVALPIGTGAIAPGAATDTASVVVNSDTYSFPSSFGVQDRIFSTLTYANTRAVDVTLEVTATGVRQVTLSSGLSGTATFRAWIAISNVTDGGLVSSTQDYMPNQLSGLVASQSASFIETTSLLVVVPAGKTFTLTPYGRLITNVGSTGSHSLTTSAYTMRIAAIKL